MGKLKINLTSVTVNPLCTSECIGTWQKNEKGREKTYNQDIWLAPSNWWKKLTPQTNAWELDSSRTCHKDFTSVALLEINNYVCIICIAVDQTCKATKNWFTTVRWMSHILVSVKIFGWFRNSWSAGGLEENLKVLRCRTGYKETSALRVVAPNINGRGLFFQKILSSLALKYFNLVLILTIWPRKRSTSILKTGSWHQSE